MEKKNCKALIVEDDPDITTLLTYILKKEGFTVTSVSDGETALSIVNEFKPDVVLLDLMLPKINGFEVCHRIKENIKTKDIKIVVVSAKNYHADINRAKKLGADEYLVKPFAKEDLIKILNSFHN